MSKKSRENVPPPFRKNDIITVDVTDTGSAGEGIARCEGMAVFIPAAAVGDRLSVRIVKVLSSMAYGKIEEIITPSPDRIVPDCPAFPKCGGCVFRHISYEAECAIKLRRVCDAFERIGGLSLRPDGIIPGERSRCRNKAQYPCALSADGRVIFGFYARHSHRLIECHDCLLQPEKFADAVRTVTGYMTQNNVAPYNETSREGLVRHLYLRHSGADGGIMICLVCTSDHLPNENGLIGALRQAVGDNITVLINVNKKDTNVILGPKTRVLYGEGYITDTLLGLSFRVSPASFFQVNRTQAERLYSIAAEFAGITPGGRKVGTLLDLYCGTGTIGLTMAHGCGKLIGAELSPDAVRDAGDNAKRNGIANAEFICADAVDAAAELRRRSVKPEVILLDPPRKGCSPDLLRTIADMRPERVVYISCDPATLARDLALLRGLGYDAVKARAEDMFPGTGHVETVCLLTHYG